MKQACSFVHPDLALSACGGFAQNRLAAYLVVNSENVLLRNFSIRYILPYAWPLCDNKNGPEGISEPEKIIRSEP